MLTPCGENKRPCAAPYEPGQRIQISAQNAPRNFCLSMLVAQSRRTRGTNLTYKVKVIVIKRCLSRLCIIGVWGTDRNNHHKTQKSVPWSGCCKQMCDLYPTVDSQNVDVFVVWIRYGGQSV